MSNTENNFIQPEWPAPANIKAFTSLRQSRTGQPQIEVNPGVRLPGNVNRELLKEMLTLPEEPLWLTQTHSTTVVKAAAENRDKNADASFSNTPNQICAVLTADCLPVLVCDREGKHVAAIHAGWRGLANGIIEETLKTLNIAPADTLVWLGPAIGPERFEVRKDVYDAFTQQDAEAANAFKLFAENHWLADIYALARMKLQRFGINEIYGGNYCTHSNEKDFYSFRRDGRIIGSIISLIWIEDSNTKI